MSARAMPGDELLTFLLSEHSQRVLDRIPAALAAEDDAVHALRTSVRRLRTILALTRREREGDGEAQLEALLAGLGRSLGAVRDREVSADLAARLLEDTGTAPDAGRVLVDTEREAQAAAHRQLERWCSGHLEPLILMLRERAGASSAEVHAVQDGKVAARRWLRREIHRTRRAAGRLDISALPEAAAFEAAHRLRKAARRVRHVSEAVSTPPAEVMGKKARRLGRRARQVQSVLGDLRDAVLLADRAQRLAQRSVRDDEGTALNAVAAVARQRAEEAQEQLPGALGGFEQAAARFDP